MFDVNKNHVSISAARLARPPVLKGPRPPRAAELNLPPCLGKSPGRATSPAPPLPELAAPTEGTGAERASGRGAGEVKVTPEPEPYTLRKWFSGAEARRGGCCVMASQK